MNRFPYARCLMTLTEGEVLDETNAYRDLMNSIGKMCREGHERAWTAIGSAIQRSFEPPHNAPNGASSRHRASADTAVRKSGSTVDGLPALDIFRYSMALKEHGDQQGQLMNWDEECLRAYPPHFKATIHVQGLSFDGTGSTKKMARHQACREACLALGIVPR